MKYMNVGNGVSDIYAYSEYILNCYSSEKKELNYFICWSYVIGYYLFAGLGVIFI